MAKVKGTGTGLVRRTPFTERTNNALGAVAKQTAALEFATDVAMRSGRKARDIAKATAGGLTKLYEAAKDKESRSHIVAKDGLGMLSGIVSFESSNWIFRKLEDSWPGFAENSDLWQSIPHFVIGLATYFGELLTRRPDAKGLKIFPGMPREVASEWGKAMALLGASNLWRALRVRRKDAKSALAQKAELEGEVAKLREKLAGYEASPPSESNQSGS